MEQATAGSGISPGRRALGTTGRAHLDREEPKEIPTFSDLDAALDVFERLVKRYRLLLRGDGGDVLPVIVYPWEAVLIEAWIPPAASLRIAPKVEGELRGYTSVPARAPGPHVFSRAGLWEAVGNPNGLVGQPGLARNPFVREPGIPEHPWNRIPTRR